MSNWTSFLAKTSVSPAVIEACCSHVPGSTQATLVAELGISIDSPADLTRLRAAVKCLERMLPAHAFESLDEEVREIAEDAKWAKTTRGRYVQTINQWAEPFFAELRSRPQFHDVAIGGHATREVVYATGFVQREDIFHELMVYIHSKKPPYKVMTDVRLGAWNGPKALP
jgi:hypothetical protein